SEEQRALEQLADDDTGENPGREERGDARRRGVTQDGEAEQRQEHPAGDANREPSARGRSQRSDEKPRPARALGVFGSQEMPQAGRLRRELERRQARDREEQRASSAVGKFELAGGG